MDVDLKEIVEASKMHPLKIRNVYIFGSRVYGTHRENSDYDVAIVGSALNPTSEIKHDKYNIHIFTHDYFKEMLDEYAVKVLECVYAPDICKLQEKQKFEPIIIQSKLIPAFIQQSYNSWHGAKIKFREGDIAKGRKGIFHALRILYFGIQLKNFGKITAWDEANWVWFDVKDSSNYRWEDIKPKYLTKKIELEKELAK